MDLIGRRCRYRWENVLVGQKVYVRTKIKEFLFVFGRGYFYLFFALGRGEREGGKENVGVGSLEGGGGVGVMLCVGEEGGIGRSKEIRKRRKKRKKKNWHVSHVGYFDLGSRAGQG